LSVLKFFDLRPKWECISEIAAVPGNTLANTQKDYGSIGFARLLAIAFAGNRLRGDGHV